MRKLFNKKGFTLAELLIVVAIIAVLTAIAIPVFTAQLNKAKYATDEANARSIYAELTSDYLANGGEQKVTLSANAVEEGTATTIQVKNGDEVLNSYDFTGIVGITFSLGTEDANPSVTVAAYNGNDVVTFGSGAAAAGSGD